MSSYSDFVGYVPDKLRLQLSGTVTGEGIVPANNLGLPNEFFVSTAQGVSTTSGGVSNPGICLNGTNSVFNIESGVTYVSFQNVVAANGNLTITGEAGGATISSVVFPKLEYTAGNISGTSSRVSGYSFPALKAAEGNISLSGTDSPTLSFSGMRRAKGFFLTYGTGGTISGLDAVFKSFIACVVPGTISSFSGIPLGTYPHTGIARITGDSYSVAENSIVILPDPAAASNTTITTSSTFTGDFLSGLKQGSVTFYSPNNFTNINLAQNYPNSVSLSTPAIFNYIVTTGVTGLTFPATSGGVYYLATLNSGAASGAPLDIQVKTTGGSGTLLGFVCQSRGNTATRRVNITISGYSAISGNTRNAVTVATTISGSGAFSITSNAPSGVFISGNDLTRFFSQVTTGVLASGGWAEYQANFFANNGPLTYTVTGTEVRYSGDGSLGVRFVSNAGTGGIAQITGNFLNALSLTGAGTAGHGYLVIAPAISGRAVLNLPQATGLYAPIVASSNANLANTVIDAPLLGTTDANGDITVYASGNSTGVATLGIPTNAGYSGAINGIAIGGSSRVTINTTGATNIGTGTYSGKIVNATFDAYTGGSCNFNFGRTTQVTLNLEALNSGTTGTFITGSVTGATTVSLVATGAITSGAGTIVISGTDLSGGSSQVVLSGSGSTGIFNFTGGTPALGSLSAIHVLATNSGRYTANYGSVQTLNTANFGGLRLSGIAASVVSLTATGVNTISSFVDITGNTSTVLYTGGQISGFNQDMSIAGTSGTVACFFTGGTPFANSFVTSGILITATNSALVTGDLGGLYRTAGLLVTGTNSGIVRITATGLSHFSGISNNPPTGTGCVTFSVSNSGSIAYTGGQISGMSGSLTGVVNNSGSITFAFTGGTPFANSSINSGITLLATGTGATPSTITGNLGGVTNSSGIVINVSGPVATVSLTATGLSNLTRNVTLTAQSGSTIFYTGVIQNTTLGSTLTAGLSGSTITFINTGLTSTGNLNAFNFIGTNADTFITGTLNNSASINTTTISTSGRVVITATGVTGADAINITGLTTSSFVTGSFPNLQQVTGSLTINYSGSGGINIGNIQGIGGSFIISGGTAAGTFPINGRSDLSGINSLTGISTATFSTVVPGFQITGLANTFSGAVVMTGLRQIGTDLSSTGAISLNNNFVSRIEATGITSFELPNLTGWYGSINLSLPNATGFNLSSVKFIGGNGGTTPQPNTVTGLIFTLGSSITGAITMTGLQYIYVRDMTTNAGNQVPTPFIFRASGATSISMPNIVTGFLRQVNTGPFTNTGTFSGASITGLTFGSSGTTKELFMNFTASGCPLNQASVDNILQTFASLDGTNATTVYSGLTIRLNGLCAAPSTTGSGYRTTLTGAGRLNTVLVN